MAENELDAPVLGVSWDGTGLRARRDGLGRRVLARGSRRLHARRPPADVPRCPAATRRSGSRGARRWACCTPLFGDDAFGMTDLAPRRRVHAARADGAAADAGARRQRRRRRPAPAGCSTPSPRSSGLRQRAALRGAGGDGAGVRARRASDTEPRRIPFCVPIPRPARRTGRADVVDWAPLRPRPPRRRARGRAAPGGSRRGSTTRWPR